MKRYMLDYYALLPGAAANMAALKRDGTQIYRSVPGLPEAARPDGTVGSGKRLLRILGIGESTIAGVGVATHEEGIVASFCRQLAQRYDATVQYRVRARSGFTMQEIVERILPKLEEDFVPDVILVGTAANDAFRFHRPDDFAKAVRRGIDTLRGLFSTSPILFLNVPPVREFPAFTPLTARYIGRLVEIHGAALASTVKRLPDVYYMNERITFEEWAKRVPGADKPEDFFSDGVHPNALTYRMWGEEAAQFVIAHEIIKSTG